MVLITVVTVSTPAVKETIGYARNLAKEGKDATFDVFYFCGDRDNRRVDKDHMVESLKKADLTVLDLMGVDDSMIGLIEQASSANRGQRIIVGRPGTLKPRLGGYDEKRFKANPEDRAALNRFSDYWLRCDSGDVTSAFNMILGRYLDVEGLPDPDPFEDERDVFIKDPCTGRVYLSRESYLMDNPRVHDYEVTVFYSCHNYPSDNRAIISELVSRIRRFADVTPITFNGFDMDNMNHLESMVGDSSDLMISLSPFRFLAGPMGGSSTAAMRFLNKVGAPFLRPFYISRSCREEWEERTSGLKVPEFLLNIFMPELDGGLCTFPIGANEETETIEEYGIVLSEIRPIPDRMDRLIGKIKGMLRLRSKTNSEKRIAIVGYNYPPGEGSLFGGSFLDTFGSLEALLSGLSCAGYDVGEPLTGKLKDEFLHNGILNGSEWLVAEDDAFIHYSGGTEHPVSVTDKWGKAPGNVMTDRKGYRIPGVVHGKIFIGLQPPRGREGSSEEYHDPYTPPHHQYLAFYEWIRDVFEADAVIHIGTHGTVEFLPGKETAMSGQCFPDVAIGDIPHFYLYYMGNPSEAMIAKRRTHAGLISYMSPPYVRSDLYGDLSELEARISEYRESLFVDRGRSENIIDEICRKADEMGLPTDIDDLEHELEDMRMSLIPSGLHVIGTPFDESEAEEFAIQSMEFPHGSCKPLKDVLESMDVENPSETADAMYRGYNSGMDIPEEFKDNGEILASLRYEKEMSLSARECHEVEGLLKCLNGMFLDVKPGGDFLRNPEIVPTGYNMVQFDPSKVPSESAFKRGREAAENTIAMYLEEHGSYPRSVAMVMWGLEVSRSQGASIGQILTYLGYKQVDDAGPFADRFEPIPLEELGRPRIDVTVTICGFFRDMFSNLVDGLNDVFRRVDELDEPDAMNPFKLHTRSNYESLISQGYSEEDARDLSLCRLFGPGEGLYGTGMTGTVNESSWEDESELGDEFNRDLRYAYSKKHRGFDSKELLKENHVNVDIVSQIRDNIEYEIIDLDHYYEFFGGLSKTVEMARGSKASMYITDNTGAKLKTRDVRSTIEHGVRTRLLNPKWIDALLETDYHGAQHINDRFENILGLAATTGAVSSRVFSDMEHCYIEDEDLRRRIRENNNWALMSMMNRLFEANKRGYWDATDEELELLREAYLESEEVAEEQGDISED